eukprot:jgi/Orpsp1_1/1175413/evm.model.c7180000053738.1
MLFKKYKDIFVDGTFQIAPPLSYQVLITRTYIKEYNVFYTTSISLLKNKEQSTYELFFEKIKEYTSISNSDIIINPKILHCDFEIAI